jgi:hypothetical protein
MKQQTFKIAFILFPFFLSCGNEKPNSDNKESKTAIQTESPLIEKEMITEPEILNSNLAKVFNPESILGEEQMIKRSVLGFIGRNFQRFEIHFTLFEKSKTDNRTYFLKGKTRVKNSICNFTGELKILNIEIGKDSIRLLDEMEYSKNHTLITITSKIIIKENPKEKHSGFIEGTLSTSAFADSTNEIHYNSLEFFSDGFINNAFEGKWTKYNSTETKINNWGDFRIPNSGDLDNGAGEFSANDKYLKNGWETYRLQYYGEPNSKEMINAVKIENDKWWE